jgi:hypothetical protein
VLRTDIDLLAGHFHAAGQFESVFIRALVPWDDLVGEPNVGHAAIADLLVTRAACAALSANFDPLIEQWASLRKVAMLGALNGIEAVQFSASANPLLKFHGCLLRNRDQTLWTQRQLPEPEIQQRVQSCIAWMTVNLPAKDLVIVGFWTDWGYLNDVLADAIAMHGINSVTIIDPASTADLEAKAPNLWAKLSGAGVPFVHIKASGADALHELRTEFSKVYARKFFAFGKPFITAAGGTYDAAVIELDTWSCEDLYNLRRDAEGIPHNRAARRKEPSPEASTAAFTHFLLVDKRAARHGSTYSHGGKTIRIVQ